MISLDDVVGGTLQYGDVPWRRMLRLTNGGYAGAMTVGDTLTTLRDVSIDQLEVGQAVFLQWHVSMKKGPVAGYSIYRVFQYAGTGKLEAFPPHNTHRVIRFQGTDTQWEHSGLSLWRCTSPGTATMRLGAGSLGSDGVIASGGASLEFFQMK